jgi:hypothetical protein
MSSRTARSAFVGALFGAIALVAGCEYFKPREPVLQYPNDTATQAAQAWADAYNRGEKTQLRMLVHPERRDAFDHHAADLHARLGASTIARFEVGAEVVVNETRSGRVVVNHHTEGTKPHPVEVLFVVEDGRWWMWRW